MLENNEEWREASVSILRVKWTLKKSYSNIRKILMKWPEVMLAKLGEVGLARVATWLSGKEGTWSASVPFADSQPSLLLQPCSAPLSSAVPDVFLF